MADQSADSNSPHLAPCIVAAWLWLAIVLFSLLVIPTLFSLDVFNSKPEQMRALMPELERWFISFQQKHGTFWLSLVGIAGCVFASLRRSVLLANAMILLGIAVMLGMIWAVLSQLPK